MRTSVPTTRPPKGNGWRLWYNTYGIQQGRSPYHYVEVEIWRQGWQQTELVDPTNLEPWFNVADLYWRPAGPTRDMGEYYRRVIGYRDKT